MMRKILLVLVILAANNSCVECYDPQNSCNMDVSFEDVKNITKIYNLNNH